MGKAVYLNVSDKKVLATKITYNDLIILYKQYIDKYGSVPMISSYQENALSKGFHALAGISPPRRYRWY